MSAGVAEKGEKKVHSHKMPDDLRRVKVGDDIGYELVKGNDAVASLAQTDDGWITSAVAGETYKSRQLAYEATKAALKSNGKRPIPARQEPAQQSEPAPELAVA